MLSERARRQTCPFGNRSARSRVAPIGSAGSESELRTQEADVEAGSIAHVRGLVLDPFHQCDQHRPLAIEGRRLDGPAGPIRAHISDYGPIGFQPVGLMFASPGCWEITGRVADKTLSFVTLVTKIGDGPAARCSALFGGYRPGSSK